MEVRLRMRIKFCTLILGHVRIYSVMSILNYFQKRTPEEQGMILPQVGNTELPGEVVASANTQVGESASEIEPRRKRAIGRLSTHTVTRQEPALADMHHFMGQQLLRGTFQGFVDMPFPSQR